MHEHLRPNRLANSSIKRADKSEEFSCLIYISRPPSLIKSMFISDRWVYNLYAQTVAKVFGNPLCLKCNEAAALLRLNVLLVCFKALELWKACCHPRMHQRSRTLCDKTVLHLASIDCWQGLADMAVAFLERVSSKYDQKSSNLVHVWRYWQSKSFTIEDTRNGAINFLEQSLPRPLDLFLQGKVSRHVGDEDHTDGDGADEQVVKVVLEHVVHLGGGNSRVKHIYRHKHMNMNLTESR